MRQQAATQERAAEASQSENAERIAEIETIRDRDMDEFWRSGLAPEYEALLNGETPPPRPDADVEFDDGRDWTDPSHDEPAEPEEPEKKAAKDAEPALYDMAHLDLEGIRQDVETDQPVLNSFYEAAQANDLSPAQVEGVLKWFDGFSFANAMRPDSSQFKDRIAELQTLQRKDARRYKSQQLDLELSGLLRCRARRTR